MKQISAKLTKLLRAAGAEGGKAGNQAAKGWAKATASIKDYADALRLGERRTKDFAKIFSQVKAPEAEFREFVRLQEVAARNARDLAQISARAGATSPLAIQARKGLEEANKAVAQQGASFRKLTGVTVTEYSKQAEAARVSQQGQTTVARAEASERIVAMQTEAAKETAIIRAAGQRRIAIIRAVVGQIRALERGLAAVFRATGRAFATLGSAVGRGVGRIALGVLPFQRGDDRRVVGGDGQTRVDPAHLDVPPGADHPVLDDPSDGADGPTGTGVVAWHRRCGQWPFAARHPVGRRAGDRRRLRPDRSDQEAGDRRGRLHPGPVRARRPTRSHRPQMVRVHDTSLELGNDLTLPGVSALQGAEAIQILTKQFGSLGKGAVPAALAAAKGVLQLSRATKSSAEDAAALVGTAVNVFGIEASAAVSIADQITGALTKAAGVGFNDFALAFKQSATVFAQFQVPAVGAKEAIIDFNTAIAVLARGGLTGSDAGTSLKQFFLQANRGTVDANENLAKLTERAGEIGTVFYDAAGQARPLTEALDIMRRGLEG